MLKLDMKTPDFADENIAKIAEIFPNCVTEVRDEKGNLTKAIDFDLLRQELSANIVDGQRERYQINWPGKNEAIVKANESINKTLRPCREESVNFDTTQNLYIESDNLDALKLIEESYLGKVKMIYIDPPYNTGKDFVYRDNFTGDKEQHFIDSEQKNEEGGKLVANLETNGRYHSDWLSMMYSRLKKAKNFLKKSDGVIFISIDDNEVHNLRRICDEVFYESNFLAQLVWSLSSGPQAGHFTRSNEVILAYARNKDSLPYFADNSGGTIKHGALKKISPVNPASEITFKAGSIGYEGDSAVFEGELGGSEKQYITKGKLKFINGILAEEVTIKAGWAMKNQLLSWLNGQETFDSKGQKVVRFYFNSQGILFYEKERGTVHPKTVILSADVGNTKTGSDEVIALMGGKYMDFPKPTSLIEFFCKIATNKNDIILDFFSGSATTAHAVMKLNLEDGGKRKFIMIQLPEETDPNGDAYKAGYKSIPELGKERIRRAGKKILEENKDKEGIENLDIGFRVLKVDSSNMKDVYYTPDQTSQNTLFDAVENIKEDRTGEDLLFQVLLDWGIDLMLPIVREEILGKAVFFVDGDTLAACFDDGIDEAFVKELAKREMMRVVFKDSGFKEDDTKSNVEQIFTQLSPDTEVRAI